MMWSMTQDELAYAHCGTCARRFPVTITECRECGASLLVVEPRPDGSRRIYLAGQINFQQRQAMSRRAAVARRRRKESA